MMEDSLKLLETSVDEILKSTPGAARLFLDWHIACVGCGFARFCKLKDAVNTYHLDEKKFLEEVAKLNIQKS